jgi:hypothetical protein
MKLTEDLELAAWAARPFTSPAFKAEAFASPRYKTDAHFRDAIMKKLALAEDGAQVTTKSYDNTTRVTAGGGIGEGSPDRSPDEEHAETYGALSVKPAARAKVQELSAKEGSQWLNGGHLPQVTEYPDQ